MTEEPQKKLNLHVRLNIYHYANNVFLVFKGID